MIKNIYHIVSKALANYKTLPKVFLPIFSFHRIAYGFTFTCVPIGASEASWLTSNYTHGKANGLLFMAISNMLQCCFYIL